MSEPEKRAVELLICATCASKPGEPPLLTTDAARALADHLPAGVHLMQTDCMSACESPVSLALQSRGRATYLFAGVDPVADAADIAATCQLYLDAENGWIEDARGCGRLRFCLRGRVPPLSAAEL